MLYSIIPPEVVFAELSKNEEKYIEIEYMGEKVIVKPMSKNQYEIKRLISTSPQAYLNPQLQPGVIIKGEL